MTVIFKKILKPLNRQLNRYSSLEKRVLYILELIKPLIRLVFIGGLYILLDSRGIHNPTLSLMLIFLTFINIGILFIVLLHRRFLQLRITTGLSLLLCLTLFSMLVHYTGGIESHFFLAFLFYTALIPFFELGFSLLEQAVSHFVIIAIYNMTVLYSGIEGHIDEFIIRNFFFFFLALLSSILGRVLAIQERRLGSLNRELTHTNRTMSREFEMAQHIQAAIMPREFPDHEGISFCGSYQPMKELGGDYYDVIDIDSRHVGIVVADVSGHGVSAALIMTMAKLSFNRNAITDIGSDEMMNRVNNDIRTTTGGVDKYLTAFLGIIDMDSYEISYTNAAHDHSVLLRKNGDIHRLPANGTIVGSFPDIEYKEERIKVHPGDRLILYTDGLVEARDMSGRQLGTEKLHALFIEKSHQKGRPFIDAVLSSVDAYSGNMPVRDDRTLLVVCFPEASNPT